MGDCARRSQPDWVIQAQLGHVSPQMMKTYSHIRRKALDEAASVLEAPDIALWQMPKPEKSSENRPEPVTSQSTSQSEDVGAEAREIIKEIGSSGWIRTSNPPVNSRMLCR